jgi:catechol 2,3-dioxygenase-like lactoylglutathione lyase family enzyme
LTAADWLTMTAPMLHHVGCAVANLDASLAHYARLLGPRRRSPVYAVIAQGVQVCFIELAPGSYLELISATASPSPIDRYVRTGFYHLCFTVDALRAAVAGLGPKFRALPSFRSEAFADRRCQFVVTPELHLIELAEISADDFAATFAATAFELTDSQLP